MTEQIPPIPPPPFSAPQHYPQPQPVYQQLAYPPVQYVVAQPSDSFATGGLICGILGLFFSFIPFIGVIAWPLVIAGVALSIISYQRRRSGLAMAGMITSGLGLLVCSSYVVLLVIGTAASSK